MSYASPAYYADRLCERGRIYLRNFFNLDRRTTLFQDFEALKRKTGAKAKDDKSTELAQHPIQEVAGRRGRARKVRPEARIKIEEDVQETIKKNIDEVVMEWAKKEWKKYVAHIPGRENPWNPRVDDHMFWM